MIDIALDKISHDLYLKNNDLQLVSGSDHVIQHIKIRLQFFKNEWFLDTTPGVPFFEDIFTKNPNIPNIENIIKAHIIDTPEVEELLEFNSDFNNSTRQYTINFKVRSIYGEEELVISLFE